MEGSFQKFCSIALPVLLIASVSASHGFVLQWTNIFSGIWNSIWNFIAGIFHIPIISAQQQFANRLGELQTNESALTQFYLANSGKYAKQYNVSVNTSWSVQLTDVNSSTSPIVGQLTVTWNNTNKSLYVYEGVVNATAGVPTFAVNMTHGTFLSLSNDALHQSIDGAIADFGIAEATHSISYARIR
ncbi:MAG: hypothetical protein KGH57_00725 [Candidatus Micrarchaeota archaeon]|nr:hypothetical protein [Candidatus Micrarchaeota archaeon]